MSSDSFEKDPRTLWPKGPTGKPTANAAKNPGIRPGETVVTTRSGIEKYVRVEDARRIVIYGTTNEGPYESTVEEAMTRQAILGNPLFVVGNLPGVHVTAYRIALKHSWPVEVICASEELHGHRHRPVIHTRMLRIVPAIALVFPDRDDAWTADFWAQTIDAGVASLVIPVGLIQEVAEELGEEERDYDQGAAPYPLK